jgi:hypothetical protein
MFMRLISWKPNKAPPQALLHVPPAMTKHEITEYLTKIYDVDVTKVMTANFLGEFSYSSSAVVLSDGLWPLFTSVYQVSGRDFMESEKYCPTSEGITKQRLCTMIRERKRSRGLLFPICTKLYT